MRLLHASCLLLLLATSPSLASSAPSAPPTTTPDLRGSWQSEPYTAMFIDATRPAEQTLQITEQQGELVRGTHTWRQTSSEPPIGTVGNGAPVMSATEPFVGVFDFDGKALHLAEQTEEGLMTVRLVDADTMELVYIEAGHQATALRTRLHRQR